jgi:hypothetical protein
LGALCGALPQGAKDPQNLSPEGRHPCQRTAGRLCEARKINGGRMKEYIIAGVLFVVALFAFWMSIRSFREKGFLFNNAYIYASKKERETMDKSPHYRQSGIVFALIGLLFLINTLVLIFHIRWLFWLVIGITAITLVCAVTSSVIIEKRKQKK